MARTILHCDMNSFYASVELLSYPELRSKPVAVCGDPKSRHGIILAKNESAKKYGVVTAETIWQARRKCPDLILLPPHRERYSAYSKCHLLPLHRSGGTIQHRRKLAGYHRQHASVWQQRETDC